MNAPKARAYDIFSEANECTNVLLAGRQGSGKSVFVHGMIYNLVNEYSPEEIELYLIDPKRVELSMWNVLPHVRGYAKETDTAITMLEYIKIQMMARYDDMAARGIRKYDGSHIYVIIDELADMMTEEPKQTGLLLRKIMQLGRAARIHIICCTQQPSRLTLPAAVQINFDCRIGLALDDKIDSRQAIKQNGCEELNIGECIMRANGNTTKRPVPMYSDEHMESMRKYWLAQRMKGVVR